MLLTVTALPTITDVAAPKGEGAGRTDAFAPLMAALTVTVPDGKALPPAGRPLPVADGDGDGVPAADLAVSTDPTLVTLQDHADPSMPAGRGGQPTHATLMPAPGQLLARTLDARPAPVMPSAEPLRAAPARPQRVAASITAMPTATPRQGKAPQSDDAATSTPPILSEAPAPPLILMLAPALPPAPAPSDVATPTRTAETSAGPTTPLSVVDGEPLAAGMVQRRLRRPDPFADRPTEGEDASDAAERRSLSEDADARSVGEVPSVGTHGQVLAALAQVVPVSESGGSSSAVPNASRPSETPKAGQPVAADPFIAAPAASSAAPLSAPTGNGASGTSPDAAGGTLADPPAGVGRRPTRLASAAPAPGASPPSLSAALSPVLAPHPAAVVPPVTTAQPAQARLPAGAVLDPSPAVVTPGNAAAVAVQSQVLAAASGSPAKPALPTDASVQPVRAAMLTQSPKQVDASATQPVALPFTPIRQPVAPVIVPALQAFGAAMRQALADDRRPVRRTAEPAGVAPVLAPTAAVRAAAPTAARPLDTADARWPQAMMQHIEQLRDAADAASTRIRLLPDALGPVEVMVHRNGDAVHVHLAAQSAETRQLLQDAQPRLAEAAEQRGVKLARAEVSAGFSDASGGDRQPPRAPATFSRTPRPAPAPAADEGADDTRIA